MSIPYGFFKLQLFLELNMLLSLNNNRNIKKTFGNIWKKNFDRVKMTHLRDGGLIQGYYVLFREKFPDFSRFSRLVFPFFQT